MIRAGRWAAALVAGVFGAVDAHAVKIDICASLAEDFLDIAPASDFFNVNENRRIRGIHMKVQQGTTVLFDGYTPDNGPSRGCASVDVQYFQQHSVTITSRSKVNGRFLSAQSSSDFHQELHSVTPVNASTVELLLDWDPGWPELDVAGWMLFRHSQLLPANHTINFHTGLCCYLQTSPVFQIRADGFSNPYGVRKHMIAHEVGHYIGTWADEQTAASKDYNAPLNFCNGAPHIQQDFHAPFHREWQSTAASEGWANFVAAWAFNSQAQADCVYAYAPGITHNMDLVAPGSDLDADGQLSCEGKPWDTNHNGVRDVPPSGDEADVASWVTARDWMADAIGRGPYPLICTGTLVNIGSEWDWTRYFWDMYTDESVSYTQLINLYDEMNPRTFDPNGGTPSTADDPVTRLNAAANTLGLSAKHNNQKDNGVHH